MDIHKPKPWHGVREFGKELATIVLGVLIALGAEQAVEWLHWQEQVQATEGALLAEVRLNLLNSYERIALAPCFNSRIGELRDRLLEPTSAWQADLDPNRAPPPKGQPALAYLDRHLIIPEMPDVFLVLTRPWPDAAYQAALASGVFNHMPRARAASYARLYVAFAQTKDWQAREHAAKVRLAALAFDTTLTPAERHEYLNVLGELAFFDGNIATNAAQTIHSADEAGFRILRADMDGRFKAFGLPAGLRACLYLPPLPLDPH